MHGIAFRFVRLIFWAALAVWIGGLVTLGVAAPSVFKSLETIQATVPDPASPLAQPKQLGGEVFGAILANFGYLELGASIALVLAVVLESLLLRGAMLRKPWHLLRVALVLAALGLFGYDRLVVYPSVLSARDAWYASLKTSATLPAGATRPAAESSLKADFDAQHKQSESLAHMKVYILLAILALTALANTHVPAMPPKKLKPLPPKTPPESPPSSTTPTSTPPGK
jgi:hypothetical protein